MARKSKDKKSAVNEFLDGEGDVAVSVPISESMEDWRNWPIIRHILKSTGQVAVVRMAGVIADATLTSKPAVNYARFAKPLEKAFGARNVKAVAIIINSPGGAPAQCSLIGDHIRSLAVEKKIPVFAFVEDVAASGGYWLACAADEIYVQPSSIVGSIGVIYSGFGFTDLIKKYGIERRIHTAGENKSFLDPFKPEDKDDVARLKAIQEDIHDAFKGWVAYRREGKLNGAEADLFEAQIFSGEKAVKNGLVDEVGRLEPVMKARFGKHVSFTDYTPDKKWSPLSLLKSALPTDIAGVLYERSFWARFGF
ncbi:MAG: S49 family peptidase [Pseudobdellovibrionaceae bacterium]